ncbi:MAG: hypothetical protein M9964_15010 [Solirubrobacterales bacterium]|nr:hypothetical protein [Solirubrobacterales bacterium]
MNVRSAITAMLALALLSPAAAGAAQGGDDYGSAPAGTAPRVTIAVLPPGTDLEAITDAVPGIAPGLLGGGLGTVPVAQSYLDMTQGSRLAQSLYPKVLPPVYVTGDRVPERIWRQVRTRAAKAPADIVPGLLADELRRNGVPIAAAPEAGSAALIAADRRGRIARTRGCEPGGCPGASVVSTDLAGLTLIAERVEGDDMLVAIERPTGDAGGSELLSAGILGSGFDGDLVSSTTRMDGYVLGTDILPTVLARYGIDPPEGITGREIEGSGGEADPAAVSAAGDRLGVVRERRSAVLGVNLMVWVGLTLLASAIWRRRGARVGLTLIATAMALVPAMLLLTAALAPSLLTERLIVGIGAPALAALLLLTARALGVERPGYLAFAAASGLSVGAEALDIVAGSPLTARSLIGPNPALGVRFFGIGNELEATIGVLLMLGTGAALSSLAPRATPSRIAAAIVFVTVLAVLVFAPGRLGADVGAAITFPAGAAIAVIGVAPRLEAVTARPAGAGRRRRAPAADRSCHRWRRPPLPLGSRRGWHRRPRGRADAAGQGGAALLPQLQRLALLHRGGVRDRRRHPAATAHRLLAQRRPRSAGGPRRRDRRDRDRHRRQRLGRAPADGRNRLHRGVLRPRLGGRRPGRPPLRPLGSARRRCASPSSVPTRGRTKGASTGMFRRSPST